MCACVHVCMYVCMYIQLVCIYRQFVCIYKQIVCIYKQFRTPRRNGRFHYEVLDVGVEHLDEAQIEQRSLNEHPGEGRQKEVV